MTEGKTLKKISGFVPSAVTAIRLALILPLVYLINNNLYVLGAALFLFSVSTDLIDGYLARKLGATSKFGTYFDATTDFIFILSLFATFITKGFCADWVLYVMTSVFAAFVLTSLRLTKVYDPVGKHYCSLLFGAIALRFFLSNQLFYDAVTLSVTAFAAASILSRATFIIEKHRSPAETKKLYK